MNGWYELTDSPNGQFHFSVKANETETLMSSELYKTRQAAEAGIESVQANCGIESRYEKKSSSNGKFYFNLKAANHQVIGTSHMYSSEALRDSGIELLKANGATETIKDLTKRMHGQAAAPVDEKRT